MHNSAWKRAWARAGLPVGIQVLSCSHYLRHTFARGLSLAGAPSVTGKALMHHIDDEITIHFSPVEVGEKLTRIERATMLRLTP